MEKINKAPFEQLMQKIYPKSTLQRLWRLKGGISAQVTAFSFQTDHKEGKTLILRQYGKTDLLQNPNIAKDEFRLLQYLKTLDMPVPKPYYFSQTPEIFPTPYIVIEFIKGESVFTPVSQKDFLQIVAENLANIHSIEAKNPELSFLPTQQIFWNFTKKDSLDPRYEQLQQQVKTLSPPTNFNKPMLLHGDFWPGNFLWKHNKLVAIIDWEDAKLGDPLADVSNSRLEILWAFDKNAMNCFTDLYQNSSTIDLTNLFYWDLFAALKTLPFFDSWIENEKSKKAMREKHTWFMQQALQKLK